MAGGAGRAIVSAYAVVRLTILAVGIIVVSFIEIQGLGSSLSGI